MAKIAITHHALERYTQRHGGNRAELEALCATIPIAKAPSNGRKIVVPWKGLQICIKRDGQTLVIVSVCP